MERASKKADNFQGQMSVFYRLETSHHLYNMEYQRSQINLLISSSFILEISLANRLHPKSIPGCCIICKSEKNHENSCLWGGAFF